jgi:hypothetical protein
MTMTTQNATVAPPASMAARRYQHALNTLVDKQTKEYTLGLALLEAEEAGYDRPREAEQTRSLLDEAIGARYRRDPKGYEQAVLRGRQELAERTATEQADAA